jgi:hypothetical protein
LAHRVEDQRREFSKFVEKEDTSVGQRDFARSRTTPPSSDERGGGCGVVRSPERPAAHQSTPNWLSGGGVDPRHLEGLVILQGRKDGWKTLGQERLSGTGRPDHEEVVSTGGCHLESLAAPAETSYDGQVRYEVVVGILIRIPLLLRRRSGPRFLTFERGTDLGQGCRR